ncbi:MAG: GyrI-like domain-containing protein [Myxococcota bacterium]
MMSAMTTLDWKLDQEPDQPVAFVRLEVAPGEAGTTVPKVLHRLRTWATQQGLAATLPYGRFVQWDGATGSGIMEVGVCVDGDAPGQDDIVRGRLHGGLGACAWHEGAYHALPQTWKTLDALVKAQGLQVRAPGYEVYTNFFDAPPEAELRTRVVLPVEPAE